jgi:hypothetical protein
MQVMTQRWATLKICSGCFVVSLELKVTSSATYGKLARLVSQAWTFTADGASSVDPTAN